MRYYGFSSGSLAYADYNKAVEILKSKKVDAIELSALRDVELKSLVENLENLDLRKYKFKSFHAPSKYETLTEMEIIELLKKPFELGYHIVIHPDAIINFNAWRIFGEQLCIENMDKRKSSGRTTEELDFLFNLLPEASFCFDIGHSRQVDPTMFEASRILKKFGKKLKYIHISEVNSSSKHEPMSIDAVNDFYKVSYLIPDNIGVIIESTVSEKRVDLEVMLAKLSLNEWDSDIDETKKGIFDFLKTPFQFFKSKDKHNVIECRVYFNDKAFVNFMDNTSPWICSLNDKEFKCDVTGIDPVIIRGYASQFFYEPMRVTVKINNSMQLIEGMSIGIEKENVKGMGIVTNVTN